MCLCYRAYGLRRKLSRTITFKINVFITFFSIIKFQTYFLLPNTFLSTYLSVTKFKICNWMYAVHMYRLPVFVVVFVRDGEGEAGLRRAGVTWRPGKENKYSDSFDKNVTFLPFRKVMTERPTDRPTNQQAHMRVHREMRLSRKHQ